MGKIYWSKQRENGITEWFDSEDYNEIESLRGIVYLVVYTVMGIVGLFWAKYWYELNQFLESCYNSVVNAFSWLF